MVFASPIRPHRANEGAMKYRVLNAALLALTVVVAAREAVAQSFEVVPINEDKVAGFRVFGSNEMDRIRRCTVTYKGTVFDSKISKTTEVNGRCPVNLQPRQGRTQLCNDPRNYWKDAKILGSSHTCN